MKKHVLILGAGLSGLSAAVHLIQKGFKIYNHECYTAFLKQVIEKSDLGEDFDEIRKIRNAVNLSNSVSKAFDFPRLSYETLLANTGAGGGLFTTSLSPTYYKYLATEA